ncbi:tail protein [Moraxella bovoculi]|uniref:Tail protein n=1 Tax=Moraxella bovoculi TaxID=386891 RepID=A0AAC8PWL0_9GAMM|nr:phage tail protein [Moraxella bovoculi]AKG08086.1 tail protein [Moraxella bovoculi]AKG11192.1 tail protein [Moraxella bovoculi]
MKKPNQLRAHLLNGLPELAQNPDRLLVFIDEGRMVNTMANGLSFEYRYTLNIIITDFAEDLASVAILLFAWIRQHQSELMTNLDKATDGVKFVADILDNRKVDLSITLPITERVIVKETDGKAVISYPPEPTYTRPEMAKTVQLIDANDGVVLGEFPTGMPEEKWLLTMPLVDISR